jgi:hypothetical protein
LLLVQCLHTTLFFFIHPPHVHPCQQQHQQDQFAAEIIPQYFDHNKFSSFARQLNFYGFRKIQTKPIRNEDFDKSTAKHVTFFNERFKRGRYELLRDIQRSTRGGGSQVSLADQAREVETLHSLIVALEGRVQDLEARWREHALRMDREIQSKVEYAVLDLLSSRQPVAPQHAPSSTAAAALQAQYMGMPTLSHTSAFHQDAGSLLGGITTLSRAERSIGSDVGSRNPQLGGMGMGWDNALLASQAAAANASIVASINKADGSSPPTLPPHPKQKSLPPPSSHGQQGISERRISERLTQGVGLHQNILAGAGGLVGGGLPSTSASNSSMLLRNAWEDKFFSTLMMQDGANRAASFAGLAAHNGIGGTVGGNAGGMGMGSVVGGPSLAALAAVQHMQQQQQQQQQGQHHHGLAGHHQQHAAVAQAYMQQQQREINRMSGNAEASIGGDSFKRQTESVISGGQGTKVDKGGGGTTNSMAGAEEEV